MGNGCYKLSVKDVVYETNDAVSLYFKKPLFSKWKYKPGQFITLVMDINGKQFRRAYSLNSTASLDKTLSVTVKKIENGRVSSFIYENAPKLRKVKVMKPMGEFTLDVNKKVNRHVVLFGGGSGITPLMSITKAVLHFEKESRISLIYCNRDESSIIFRNRLAALKEEFGDRFQLRHVLEQPSEGIECSKGLINKEIINHLLKELPDYPANRTEYYICGPGGMMEVVENSLHDFHIPDDHIHLENFQASLEAMDPEMLGTESHDVMITFKGQNHHVTVDPGTSILDAALDAGLDIPYSCMSGICSTCMGTCKSGNVKMAPGNILSKEQEKGVKQDKVLTCVGHPITDDVEISFD